MKFDDLDDKAKERAREKWREYATDHDWWEFTYQDAIAMGALLGLTVGAHPYAAQYGNQPTKMLTKPDIWFSGFSCQGDGCCWSGHLDTDKLSGAVERVKAEAPQDTALHDLAALAEELHALIVTAQVASRLSEDEDVEWPDVEIGMRISVTGNERSYSTRVDTSLLPDEIEKAADKFVDGFADWIYGRLEQEHDYLTSDESVDENIRANEVEFDEDEELL